jgi:glycyl-radical enzyme activating protein family
MGNEIKGTIFDIQRFCLQDGPGIRTVIFFKGCPLKCIWCHNPEGLSKQKDFIYYAHKCAGCQACKLVCEKGVHNFKRGKHLVDYKKCDKCGKCVEVCCYGAVSIIGHRVTIKEIIDSARIDVTYNTTGGGVTLSGGEPMFQPQFVIKLAMAIKNEGINLCMETCGFASSENFKKIAPYIDLFLFDYKATDEVMHKEFTGVSNKLIIKNLGLLNSLGKKIVLRCPLIPGVNDSTVHLKGIARIANRYQMIKKVEILTYHRMGETKRIQMGKAESLPKVNRALDEQKKEWLSQLKDYGCSVPIKIN